MNERLTRGKENSFQALDNAIREFDKYRNGLTYDKNVFDPDRGLAKDSLHLPGTTEIVATLGQPLVVAPDQRIVTPLSELNDAEIFVNTYGDPVRIYCSDKTGPVKLYANHGPNSYPIEPRTPRDPRKTFHAIHGVWQPAQRYVQDTAKATSEDLRYGWLTPEQTPYEKRIREIDQILGLIEQQAKLGRRIKFCTPQDEEKYIHPAIGVELSQKGLAMQQNVENLTSKWPIDINPRTQTSRIATHVFNLRDDIERVATQLYLIADEYRNHDNAKYRRRFLEHLEEYMLKGMLDSARVYTRYDKDKIYFGLFQTER